MDAAANIDEKNVRVMLCEGEGRHARHWRARNRLSNTLSHND